MVNCMRAIVQRVTLVLVRFPYLLTYLRIYPTNIALNSSQEAIGNSIPLSALYREVHPPLTAQDGVSTTRQVSVSYNHTAQRSPTGYVQIIRKKRTPYCLCVVRWYSIYQHRSPRSQKMSKPGADPS
jgi:hypothetical protein